MFPQQHEKPVIEGDLATVIDRLQKKEAFQSEEIARYEGIPPNVLPLL